MLKNFLKKMITTVCIISTILNSSICFAATTTPKYIEPKIDYKIDKIWVDTSYWKLFSYTVGDGEHERTKYYWGIQPDGFYAKIKGKAEINKKQKFVFTKWHKKDTGDGKKQNANLELDFKISNLSMIKEIRPANVENLESYHKIERYQNKGTECVYPKEKEEKKEKKEKILPQEQKKLIKPQKYELPKTIIDEKGITWTRVSDITPVYHTFPEIRFEHYRKYVAVDYYAEWIGENENYNDNAPGHFLGSYTNIWDYHDNGLGQQIGYTTKADMCLFQSEVRYKNESDANFYSTGADFFNKNFTSRTSYIDYDFHTNKSFDTDIVFFINQNNKFLNYLESKYPSTGTGIMCNNYRIWKIIDTPRIAHLERRLKRPVNEFEPNGEMTDAPHGINYGYYDKNIHFNQYATTKPPASDPNWLIETKGGKKHYYYYTGNYSDETFHYVAPPQDILIGYEATYKATDAPIEKETTLGLGYEYEHGGTKDSELHFTFEAHSVVSITIATNTEGVNKIINKDIYVPVDIKFNMPVNGYYSVVNSSNERETNLDFLGLKDNKIIINFSS